MVELHLAKVDVASSNLVSRSFTTGAIWSIRIAFLYLRTMLCVEMLCMGEENSKANFKWIVLDLAALSRKS